MASRWVAAVGLSLLTTASSPSRATDRPGVYLEVPTVEASLVGGGGRPSPGMHQSLWIATDVYQLAHFGIGKAAGLGSKRASNEFWSRVLIGLADVALLELPGGLAWQHEEWHRAVLSNRGITSFNDVYKFDFGTQAIAVSHVSDAGLIRLKRDHPAELVRLSTAGMEANYELATNLEKTQFFYKTRSWNVVALWTLYASNILYMRTCASSDANGFVNAMNNKDGADVSHRDFTGPDCTGWTYDLFRPDEPYQARGVHPSGVGINRYRKFSDLTAEEQDYLRTERNLSLLNLIDPALIGLVDFSTGPLRWNAHVRSMPTAFGSTINLEGFLSHRQHNLFFAIHAYRNHERVFPGLSVELWRLPMTSPWGFPSLTVSARVGAWLQPDHQQFHASSASPGGLIGARMGLAVSRFAEPYVEVDGKTAGWVAGNVHLDPAVVIRAGLTSMPF